MAIMLFDHIDLRVSNLARARELYDRLMNAMGFTVFDAQDRNINYHLPGNDRATPFFGLMEEDHHQGNASRIAFRARSREEVDRLAALVQAADVVAFEPPQNYDSLTPWYYATFFEDMDGNKLEICYRD